MTVPICKKVGSFHDSCEKKTLPALCDAHIPLSFIKKISSGTIDRLKQSANIRTLEELYLVKEDVIRDVISNRKILQEIFDLREQIHKMVRLAKYRNILLFEKRACGSNIKMKPNQRAQLIGVAIFANLCKDVLEVISYTLQTDTQIFREKALIKKLVGISNQSIKKQRA
jgi:hypothetical protein